MFKACAPTENPHRPSGRGPLIEALEGRLLLASYSIADLGTLGGASSYAYDINSSNQVVGYAKLASGADRAFLFSDTNNNGIVDAGEMVDLGVMAGFASSYAYAINNNGMIVGTSLTAANQKKAVQFQSGGNPVDLQMGLGSSAYDVNNNGEIVGAVVTGVKYIAAYRSPTGQVIHLSTFGSDEFARSEAFGINDSGTIVGYSNTDGGDSAFMFPPGGTMTPIGFTGQPTFYNYTYAWGINASGQMVGEGFNADLQYHGFLQDNANLTDLGIPAGFTTSQALAINNWGQIVGQGKNGAGDGRAVTFINGVAYDLNTLIPANSGWTLTIARSINDSGYIVGQGISPSGQIHAFLLTPQSNLLTISGDRDFADEDDTIVLRRDAADPSLVDVFVNNQTEVPTSTFVPADYLHVFLNGGGGNDRITLDFSNGDPLASAGASVDGQNGTSDLLQVVLTDSADAITINSSRLAIASASIYFSNVEAMQIDGQGGDDSVAITASLPFTPRFSGGDGSDSLAISSGAYTLSTDAGVDSVENISLQNNARLDLQSSQHLSSLTLGDNSRLNLLANGARFIRVNTLSIAAVATLDMFDNDLIIQSTSADRDAALASLTDLIRSARNAATRWGGPGIGSSAAASNPLNTLAAMINDNGLGMPIRTELNGETLDQDVILVMYTAVGDMDLNEVINADDYAQIDTGFATHQVGYRWGDLDYSGGSPNADDYFLIDQSFARQDPPLAASSQSIDSAKRKPRRSKKNATRRSFISPSTAVDSASATWASFRSLDMPASSRFWVVTQFTFRRIS